MQQYVGAPCGSLNEGTLHAGHSTRVAPRGLLHADLFNTDVRSILMVLLAFQRYSQMSNGRATGDNVRGSSSKIDSMGQNGLLYYPMGFLASRDNVWTTPPDMVQANCTKVQADLSSYPCFERNRHADNAVAVLSGGPVTTLSPRL